MAVDPRERALLALEPGALEAARTVRLTCPRCGEDVPHEQGELGDSAACLGCGRTVTRLEVARAAVVLGTGGRPAP